MRDYDELWVSGELSAGASFEHTFGKLTVTLTREEKAWHLANWHLQDRFVRQIADQRTNTRQPIHLGTTSAFRAQPRPPPRNIVARPLDRIVLPPGEEVTVFFGVPVWVSIEVENALSLCDLPSEILSDTWFGETPRAGELCFAADTHIATSLDTLVNPDHHAVAPVTLVNDSGAALPISRVSLPAPALPLFYGEIGLWTAGITITCKEALIEAHMTIHETPPLNVGVVRRLGDARHAASDGRLISAVRSLLG